MAKRQTTFLLKRSNVPGKIPPSSGLTSGELALNTADAILYTSGTTGILPIGWDRLSIFSGGTVYAPVTIDSNLTVYSGFTFISGASDGYVLTSDSSGNATWEPLQPIGTSAIYSNTSNFISGVTKTITHNLNTTNVLVQTIDTNTNELIYVYVDNYQTNSVDVTINETLNNVKVVVAGGTFVELSGDTSVTAFTYNDTNTFTISNSNGSNYSATFNTVSGLTINGSLISDTISATTYLNLPTISGNYLPLSGGTVYGDTIFTNGLSANTLFVSGLTETSGITSTGGIIFPQKTINSTYTAQTEDYMIDASGGTFTVYLPTAVGVQGKLYNIKNNGGGAITVQPFGSETIDDKPFVILGETNTLQLVSNGSDWVSLGYNISTVNSSTGVFEFTGITTASTTTFYVSPVKGWIVDDTTNPLSPQLYYLSYSGGVHTDNYVNTDTETFVFLNSGGTISQQQTPLTEQQRRQNIFLGKISHPDKTSIYSIFNQPDFVLSPLAQLRDMFSPINLINGGILPSTNGANLKFNTSAGYLYGLGINFSNSTLNPNSIYITGASPRTFQYRTQTGATLTDITDIDPLNYDVSGVKTLITGTKATNQRIYLLQDGSVRVMYGQHIYNTLALAIESLQNESFTTFPNFSNDAVLIGVLSVLSTATDLTDTTKAKFFFASKFGETVGSAGGTSTTTLQQAYNNSTSPEIVTNSTLDGVQFRGGTGNDNDKNLIIETNAGVQTAWITASGDSKFNSLSATSVYTDYIDFNTTASTTTQFGRINWDSGTGTLNVGIGDSTTGLIDFQVGQEEVVRVYNSEATTLQKGEIVYVSGSQGSRPSVKRASAVNDGYSVTTLGMVDLTIPSGSEGYVTTFGIISNLNTLGLSGGTPIWLSPVTPGAYTTTKPQAPNHTVLIGYVIRVSATVGSVFVNISNGWELDELHDVRISGVTEGDLLVRGSYSGTPVWVNSKTLNGNYTISGNTSQIGDFGVTGKTITTNLQITSGATDTYVLTSDVSGNASWQPPSGGSSAASNLFNYYNFI